MSEENDGEEVLWVPEQRCHEAFAEDHAETGYPPAAIHPAAHAEPQARVGERAGKRL